MLRLITACLLLFPLFADQPLPDGKELWKQSDEALAKYRSYQCELVIEIEMIVGGERKQVTVSESVAVVNPNKMRMETKSQSGGSLVVSNGESTWVYEALLRQYTREPATQSLKDPFESVGLGKDTDASKKAMATARTLREEPLQIDGTGYPCWVVEATADKIAKSGDMEMTGVVATIWIDKETKIPRQTTLSGTMHGSRLPGSVEMKQKTLVRALKLDVDLADSLFRFVPPADAREVKELGELDVTSELEGKAAPPLRVKSLAGETFDLASLKGKIVLLEFWATWCGPCRKEMPTVEKIHKEFKASGLVVLGLNVGEERQVVERFLKMANVSYPVALTDDADVAFQVSEIPTYVVIDREGKVAAYQVGGAGEAVLRESLSKAGLKATTAK